MEDKNSVFSNNIVFVLLIESFTFKRSTEGRGLARFNLQLGGLSSHALPSSIPKDQLQGNVQEFPITGSL